VSAKSVQISLPAELLKRLDRTAEVKAEGRSAVIRKALLSYLQREHARETDAAYDRAYAGRAAEVSDEFSGLQRGQRWPKR
jgi:metal-responsive CopG/Arc/MetJ family transcriptional regulator